MKNSLKIVSIVITYLLLVGCSDSGKTTDPIVTASETDVGSSGAGTDTGDGTDTTGGTGDPAFAAIAGLWDYTEDDDIQYQEFHADGTTTNWDYDADFWGDGENCYVKVGPFPLTHLGNNVFEGFAGLTATVTVDGNQMTVTDIDGTFVYPRLLGVSSTDFTVCG